MKISELIGKLVLIAGVSALVACGGGGSSSSSSDIQDPPPNSKTFNVDDVLFNTEEETEVSLYFDVNSPSEGEPVTYHQIQGPSNGSLIGSFPDVTYRPDTEFNGTDSVRIYLSQGDISSEEITITVNVSPIDDPPVISGQPLTEIIAYDDYEFTPSASDADSSHLVFSIENKPDWLNFSAATGKLRGVPENSHDGIYSNIIIQVFDLNTIVALPPFTIEVSTYPWIKKTATPVGSRGHAAAQVNGVLYLIGGTGADSKKVTAYYPESNTWESKARLHSGATSLTAHSVNGLIYVFSGYNAGYENRVQIYNPVADSWAYGTPAPTSRMNVSSAVVDGKIYVIGGRDSNGNLTTAVEVYDPVTDSWATRASLPKTCEESSASAIEDKIYVVGGCFGTAVNTVEIYDSASDSWSSGTPMNHKRFALSTVVVDGKLYAIGGYNDGEALNTLEVYDPVRDEWSAKKGMKYARLRFATEVLNGKIYVIGGDGAGTYNLRSVEMYDPSIDN